MVTIVNQISAVWTFKETRFSSTAPNIIEGDVSRTRSIAVAAPRVSALSIPVPHAPTKNLCIIHVPIIMTHGSPGSVVKHLHTTFSVRATTNQLCIFRMCQKKITVGLSAPLTFKVYYKTNCIMTSGYETIHV